MLTIHNHTNGLVNIIFQSALQTVHWPLVAKGAYVTIAKSPATLTVTDPVTQAVSHYAGLADNAYIRSDDTKGWLWVAYG